MTIEPLAIAGGRGPKPWLKAGSVNYTSRIAGMLERPGARTLLLPAHSVAVVPNHMRARLVSHDAEHPASWLRLNAGCHGAAGLFDDLRAPIVSRLPAGDPLRMTLEDVLVEIAERGPGSCAMIDVLLRRCLILLLRSHCAPSERRLSRLAALGHAGLGRALQAMYEKPERPFTLAALAEIAGMSRSVFAACFASTLGCSVMGFLRAMRLAKAAQMLEQTDLPVKAVASRVGYRSRSSFTRAFLAKQRVGPVAFRAALHLTAT